MHLTGLDRLLWAFSFAGHCILLVVLLAKRRVTTFPIFSTLIAVNIIRTIVLYLTFRFGSQSGYFYTYWTLALLDTGLQLGIAYELASHVFRPLGVWAPDVRRSFAGLLAVSIFIAIAITWLAAPPTTSLKLGVVIRGDFFSSALLSEIFVAMLALSVSLGLPWRTHVARLAQGFGIYSMFGIVTDAVHTYYVSDSYGSVRVSEIYKMISQVQIGFYLVCLSYWTITLSLREPEPRKLPEQLHAELRVLQSRAALMLKSLRTIGSPS